MNIHTLFWDEAILAHTEIKKAQLSAIVSPYHIEYLQPGQPFTRRLAMFIDTAFVVGGSDGGLANLGGGAIAEGSMAITIGTSGAARMTIQQPYIDSEMRTFCYHLKDSTYISGGASNNGAIVLQWLKENLLQNDEVMEDFFEVALRVEPGSDDLLFLPYILGERAPLWNSNARGVMFGLSIAHSRPHLVRAAMEAVVFNLYSIGKVLMERVKITTIFATGGFVKNQLWVQMIADMFDVKVLVNEIEESSAWGAVIVGMEALETALAVTGRGEGKSYTPNPVNHRVYLQSFKKFERIYGLVKSEFEYPALLIHEH